MKKIGKHVLKILKDFYQQDFNVGDTVPFFEGKYKILDKTYQNEYGEFILCELMDESQSKSSSSKTQTGIKAHSGNRYEIVGTIHIPGYRNLLAGPGFYVRDRKGNTITGLSVQETMNLLFKEGATNAEGVRSINGFFHSTLINAIEGLPYFDSHYWKIPYLNEDGEAFAELSKAAKARVERAEEYVSRERKA